MARNTTAGKGKAKAGAKWSGFKRFLTGAGILLLLLMIPVGMAAWSWLKVQRPYKGYEGAEKLVTVEPGMGASQVLDLLQREGVLADAKLARPYLIYFMGDPRIQAGEYLFRGPLSTPEVLRKLAKGEVATRSVTLIEGLTLEEAARQIAGKGFGREEVLLDLMRSPELIADLDPEATDLEGYLFPETYSFSRGTSEREVVATMVKTFRRLYERDVRPVLARNPDGRTLRQVVTLASIVEKEAQVPTERPLIAGVYRNRLQRGIGLGADPTVIYALKRLGRWNGNIRRDDLRVDSPYNTYRYAGLPPGPICSPGLASLEAAAAPADVPYLYFVSRNDGTHVFAETLAEHSRNVEQWQRRYWRERRARERREREAQASGATGSPGRQ
ncbi:MAG TPA: endolytic transglycosylase MltG [Thermoanaerobaculia bacterium]|nr:endolytic transglycosylase MltG [Thermoanaerobaculia bacterium]